MMSYIYWLIDHGLIDWIILLLMSLIYIDQSNNLIDSLWIDWLIQQSIADMIDYIYLFLDCWCEYWLIYCTAIFMFTNWVAGRLYKNACSTLINKTWPKTPVGIQLLFFIMLIKIDSHLRTIIYINYVNYSIELFIIISKLVKIYLHVSHW